MECQQPVTMIQAYNFDNVPEGIFSDLQKFSPPWALDGTDISAQLDLMYYGMHSGEKLLNRYWQRQAIRGNNGVFLQTQRAQIAQMLLAMYGTNWQKLYNTLSFDYDPISNYDMIEEENEAATDSQTHGGTDTTTETPGVKTTEIIDHNITHGGTDTTTETPGVTTTETTKQTDTHGGTDTTTETPGVKTTETIDRNTTHGGTDTTTETPGASTTETTQQTDTHGGTDTTTQTPGVTETVKNEGSADTSSNQNVYGFNSVDAVPTDTATGKNTALNTQTTTRTGEDKTATEHGETLTVDGTRTTTHEGENISAIQHGETIDETDTHTTEHEGANITAIEHGETITGDGTRTTTHEGDNITAIKHGETIDDTATHTTEHEGANTTAIEHGETIDGTRQGSRTLTRKGNIGVTTSQQMIQAERELWIWNFFTNTVFPDIDRALTLSVY